METNKITKKEFDKLYDDGITKKEYDEILAKIDNRFNYIPIYWSNFAFEKKSNKKVISIYFFIFFWYFH